MGLVRLLVVVVGFCASWPQSFSGQSMSLEGEEAWIKWQFTAVLRKCFPGDLTITELLLVPKIAENFVLYSERYRERVIKPAVTSQVRNKCWEMLLSWKDHPEGYCSGPDKVTIDSNSMTFLKERKPRLNFEEKKGKYYFLNMYKCLCIL